MTRPVSKWAEDLEKFRELILYVSQRSASDPKFGATKLNKILFYSDFTAYAALGKPITGVEYQKLPNGPAPRQLKPIRSRMVDERELAIQEVPLRSGKLQHRTINLRKPDLTLFTSEEISLVDSIMADLRHADADTVSGMSHKLAGWQAAGMNETIPYETYFISDEPLTKIDKLRAIEVAREYGLVPA